MWVSNQVGKPKTSPGTKTPAGISGRKLVITLLAVLLLFGSCLVYVLTTYDRLEQIRGDCDSAWRALATLLEMRYQPAEKAVAAAVDAGTVSMEAGERFRLAIDAFHGTASSLQQSKAAQRVEDAWPNLPRETSRENALGDSAQSQALAEAISPALRNAIDEYNACQRREREILDSIGGRVLDLFLELPEPTEFRASQ